MAYKVTGYDSFSHENFPLGAFKTLELAKAAADKCAKGKQMTLAYVYDVHGKQVYKVGSF